MPEYAKTWRSIRPWPSYVDPPAAAPIDPCLPGQQPLIDQISAECGDIGMPHGQQRVHLPLRVADAGLEDPDEVMEDDEPLAVLGRDRHQPAVTDEGGQDGVLRGILR